MIARKIADCIAFSLLAIAASFGAVVALGFLGLLIETLGQHQDEIRACQKQALTPYEFHQCK
jgi:hypothetical protein